MASEPGRWLDSGVEELMGGRAADLEQEPPPSKGEEKWVLLFSAVDKEAQGAGRGEPVSHRRILVSPSPASCPARCHHTSLESLMVLGRK